MYLGNFDVYIIYIYIFLYHSNVCNVLCTGINREIFMHIYVILIFTYAEIHRSRSFSIL